MRRQSCYPSKAVCSCVFVPAGSLRCDRLVRSSLASSIAGFISGGRFGSLPVWMATSVVSTVLSCACQQTYSCPSPFYHLQGHAVWAYLSALQLEDQLHLVAVDLLVRDLRGHPAFGRVWLPCPRPNVVDVCHGRRVCGSPPLNSTATRYGQYQYQGPVRPYNVTVLRRRAAPASLRMLMMSAGSALQDHSERSIIPLCVRCRGRAEVGVKSTSTFQKLTMFGAVHAHRAPAVSLSAGQGSQQQASTSRVRLTTNALPLRLHTAKRTASRFSNSRVCSLHASHLCTTSSYQAS